MGIFDLFKESKKTEVQVIPKPTQQRSPEEIQKFIDLAMILSDQDLAFLKVLTTYQENNSIEFQKAFQEGIDEFFYDEFAEGLECIEIERLVLYGLVYFGYIGHNDWKFGLDDFIFNLEQAFQHYGLDTSVYDSIEEPWDIVAPEAFEKIKEKLPSGMVLGLWDTECDEYMLILTKKETLEKAISIAQEVEVKIEIL